MIWVDPAGRARLDCPWPGDAAASRKANARAAYASVMSGAAVPFECGSDIVAAPARGGTKVFTPRAVTMTASGPRSRPDGYAGRRAMQMADAFDVMTEQAQRRHAAVVAKARREWEKGLRDKEFRAPPFVPPFTVGQVVIGREYAALVERCAASGVKCASLEALRSAASGGGDREVAILRDFQRLRVFERRIGNGLAKEVRRLRPGKPKSSTEAAAKRALIERQRKAILAQTLVDSVCVGEMSLTEVLEAHGWASDHKARSALRHALCSALDRMRGFDLARPQNVG
ncbi:hypothetical protein [Pseudooceanicola nanhaiensis]|uniref:hypothetical protein n=1 Tax=Pseudooceanicola nanhaiensis TaxID=375761 RepID=UPI0012EB13EC|nr:hypothetical protein [Pseudooceanicola nanhaiensis]